MKTWKTTSLTAIMLFAVMGSTTFLAADPVFSSCSTLQDAYRAYAYADFTSAEQQLMGIRDGQLSKECTAEKYLLLGALDVIAFITQDSPSLSPADEDFQSALKADPFVAMRVETFPPLLIRSRFERNRRILFNADVESGVATHMNPTVALENSRNRALESYLSQFISAAHFASVLENDKKRDAMLSADHISRTQTITIPDGNAVRVETKNLIQRNRILEAANGNNILFDIERPYVKLDIRESLDGTPSESRVALTRIKQHLAEAGFLVIDENSDTREAHILIRGNVDASAVSLNYNMGYGGTAISNLTMIWADGSQYNFGSSIEKKDGIPSRNQRESMFSALEVVAGPLAEHITSTCIKEWNDRMVNGAVYRVELTGLLDYDDFKKVLTQLSTWTLNDPLDNPTFSAEDHHQIFVKHRPNDGDLADILRKEGFYNLSRDYTLNIIEAAFNRVVISLGV